MGSRSEGIGNVSVRDVATSLLFFLYFCDDVFASILFRFVGSELIAATYAVIFFGLLAICISLTDLRRLSRIVICYVVIAILITSSIFLHPEYADWFFGERYGVSVQFLSPRGGIWALIVVGLMQDRKQLIRALQLVAGILLVYQTIRFGVSQAQGYWEEMDASGNEVHKSYSLYFGYEVLFSSVTFGAIALFERKKWAYIPFILGVVLILLGGSRGPLICVLALIGMAIAFHWKTMAINVRCLLAFLIIGISLAVVTGIGDELLRRVTTPLGIQSRTIYSLLSGELTDGNGREAIYPLVMDMIENGGLFGYGVYGERPIVGRTFAWGYAHNIFLELFVAFGFVGGTLVTVALVFACIRTCMACKSTTDMICMSIFISCSCKLLLSDSFWYYPQFWALISIMLVWKWQTPPSDVSSDRSLPAIRAYKPALRRRTYGKAS